MASWHTGSLVILWLRRWCSSLAGALNPKLCPFVLSNRIGRGSPVVCTAGAQKWERPCIVNYQPFGTGDRMLVFLPPSGSSGYVGVAISQVAVPEDAWLLCPVTMGSAASAVGVLSRLSLLLSRWPGCGCCKYQWGNLLWWGACSYILYLISFQSNSLVLLCSTYSNSIEKTTVNNSVPLSYIVCYLCFGMYLSLLFGF